MALNIENMYERYVWDEWSRLLRKVGEYRVRKHFYPHNMDVLDDMTKKITLNRREQVEYTKSFEHIFKIGQMHCDYSIDYQEWRKQTREINDFIDTFSTFIKNSNLEHFVEKFKSLQNTRLQTIISTLQIRIEESYRQEAAEGLLLLRKRENQLREKEQKKKAKQAQKEEKNKPSVLRRSSRIMNQNSKK
jgi:hypothetical protein